MAFLKRSESTIPPVTAAAWPTIYSGLEPKDHGVMDFLCIDRNYTRQLLYYDDAKNGSFWEVLAARGFRCLVVTPAMMLKLNKGKNIDMVTGWPLPPRYSSKELEVAARRFNFKGESETGLKLDKGTVSIRDVCRDYVKSINARSEFSKYLIKRNDYDLVFVCFTETDRIQHYTLNKDDWQENVGPLYKAVSDFIEWTIEHSRKNDNESLIMLVSDHGAQPVRLKFLVNKLLIDNNFARLKTDKSKIDENTGTISTKVQKAIGEQIMRLPMRRAIYQKLPSVLKKKVEKFIDRGLSQAEIHEDDFDMRHTQAFASVSYGPVGMIWLNDRRLPDPGIEESEKKKVHSDIIRVLKGVKSAEGDPLIKEVIDGLSHYKGSEGFIPPDIIFILKDNYVVDFSSYSDSVFIRPELKRSGDHTLLGVFGAASIHNKMKLRSNNNLSLSKIYPTILEYFGLDGKAKSRSMVKD